MTHDQAYKSARKAANKHCDTRIVYYDLDYAAFGQCKLETWEFWIDEGIVSDSELRDVVYG